MARNYLETRAHTGRDGKLQLELETGFPDAEVTIVVRPASSGAAHDANGWPSGQYEQSGSSMPDRRRSSSHEIEERLPLE
jgi:hypothetical protein